MVEKVAPAGFSRRRVFGLGAGVAGGLAATLISSAHADSDGDSNSSDGSDADAKTSLPVAQMDKILQAEGTPDGKVVGYSFTRTDLHGTLPGGIEVLSDALLSGDVYFQSIGPSRAILNGDFCLTQDETNKFIDALLANGLTVQAFHQHLSDISPMAWFQHFRGEGDPLQLAQALASAIKVTGAPMPQSKPPAKNATPFDKKKLQTILGGDAEVQDKGVVAISVERAEAITLGGQSISRDLNVATNIYFQPLDHDGKQALAIPDFGMLAKEVDAVLKKMRALGWTVGCLYNQETDEQPQLYWAHMWKTGGTYQLAQEIRDGLDLCNMKYETAT